MAFLVINQQAKKFNSLKLFCSYSNFGKESEYAQKIQVRMKQW